MCMRLVLTATSKAPLPITRHEKRANSMFVRHPANLESQGLFFFSTAAKAKKASRGERKIS